MERTYEVNDLDKSILPEFIFKTVFSGNSGVGKTSILNYELQIKYNQDNNQETIVEHYYKNYEICNKIIRIQIWDTCGKETYEEIVKTFYRSALCIFVVFSLDDESSFLNLNHWIVDFHNTNESPIVILIGNKKDNVSGRKVSKERINKFCKDNDIDSYYETSAKTGGSIHEIFKEVIRKLYIKFIDTNASNGQSIKSFDSTEQSSEKTPCGFNGDSCKVCDCSIY